MARRAVFVFSPLVSPLKRKELLLALAKTASTVKLSLLNGRCEMLCAPTVAAFVARGGIYTWRERASGVRKVTQQPEPLPAPWQPCYRTTGAPAYGPQPGTMDRYESRPAQIS